MSLKKEIVDFAQNLGIDRVAFTDASPFLKEREILQERKAKGLISPFEEENIDRRCFPDKLMPGAKTIICFAIGYLLDPLVIEETTNTSGEMVYKGKFSRYAMVLDYHRILENKLNAVVQYILSKHNGNFKIFVDNGSLMDKAAAQRAGIGWIGENTCLFTPEFGSWVFLGEILTDIEIEPDEPLESKCDHCGKCIRACPTTALTAPFTINPFRCLSYITQKRGIIPKDFLKSIGNRIFGCDTCQEACPHNRDVLIPCHEEFIPPRPLETNLKKLIKIDNAEFDKTFKPTAAGWRGKSVIKRNTVCALANMGGKESVMLLRELIDDPSEIVRSQALLALQSLEQS